MKCRIVEFLKDEEDDWYARLECRHNQHVRHNPPWQNRPWVLSESGRQQYIGHELDCKKCESGEPADWEV